MTKHLKYVGLGLCLTASAVLAGACSAQRSSGGGVIEPSPLPTSAGTGSNSGGLIGTWTSAAGATAAENLSSCSNFELSVSAQSGNTATGNFSTICQGAYRVAGTASGTLTNNVLHIVLQATTTLPTVGACAVTVTSDATLDGDLIRLPFTATTCLGSFTGTETLRKSDLLPKPPAPEPEPEPAPAPPPPPPAPEPTPTPPPPADELNLGIVNIVLGPQVASWPQTSTITNARTGGSQLCINHTYLGRWPTVGFFDTGAPIEGNQWIFANIGGQWYGGAGEWIRPGQECKSVDADTIGIDAFAGRPGLGSWRPKPGETFGVMVSTPARAWPSMRTTDERSNIVFVQWNP